MATRTGQEIHQEVVALIGEEAASKLYEGGFSVVDAEQLAAFVDEHEQSNDRLREVAAEAMRSARVTTTRVEIKVVNGVPTIIATHPAGDEKRLVKDIAKLVSFFLGEKYGARPVKSPDTIEREEIRDTNDVAVAATPPSPSDDNAEPTDAA